MRLRTIISQQQISEHLVIDESTYPARASLPPHTDGIDRISLILQGCPGETYLDRLRTPGCLAVVGKAADTLHTNIFSDTGCRIFSMIFLRNNIFQSRAYCWSQHPRCVLSMLRIREAVNNTKHANSTRRLVNRELESLLPTLCENPQHAPTLPAWWDDAFEILTNGAIQGAAIPAIARRIGVHPVHLNRLCQRAYGRSTCAYLRWKRVQHAAEFLNNPSMSLARAASISGFYDQAHMTRAFASELSMTPRSFQLSQRCADLDV